MYGFLFKFTYIGKMLYILCTCASNRKKTISKLYNMYKYIYKI